MKIPDFLILPTNSSESPHSVGGSHRIAGADCPNCERPLMLHLTLDLKDERLGMPHAPRIRLPLLYCMRCELAHWDFVYSVLGEDSIEIESFVPGDDLAEEWEELEIGDEFPWQKVLLAPPPEEFLLLCDQLNRNKSLNDSETKAYCAVSGHRANPEVGAYPIVDVVNQVGARAFLQQRPGAVQEVDGTKYDLLAALCNDRVQGLKFTHGSYQIVFWINVEKMRILVTHYI